MGWWGVFISMEDKLRENENSGSRNKIHAKQMEGRVQLSAVEARSCLLCSGHSGVDDAKERVNDQRWKHNVLCET